jgi:molybdenum-dependent DNA-binding transcriptional regulator ModE
MIDDNNGSLGNDEKEAGNVPFEERGLCGARVSHELLISGNDARPDRAQRHDGWTPERVRIFLDTLAESGVVADAARAAGMSVRSAYRLRNRADGGAFNVAWIAAQLRARQRLGDAVLSRALHGCVELVVREGEVWAEKHRYDNRLTMAVLSRLDRLAEAGDDASRAARFVAQEFDQFVDLVCAGGDGAAAFIGSRELAEYPISRNDTARNLARLESYRRHREGLTEEVGVSEPVLPAVPDDTEASGDEAANASAGESGEDDKAEGAATSDEELPAIVVTWLPPSDG